MCTCIRLTLFSLPFKFPVTLRQLLATQIASGFSLHRSLLAPVSPCSGLSLPRSLLDPVSPCPGLSLLRSVLDETSTISCTITCLADDLLAWLATHVACSRGLLMRSARMASSVTCWRGRLKRSARVACAALNLPTICARSLRWCRLLALPVRYSC